MTEHSKIKEIRQNKSKEADNKISKLMLLFLFSGFGLNLFSQYSITNEGNVLTKWEFRRLQKVIDYQLEFYNKVFPDSMMESSSVKVTIFNRYVDYLLYQDAQDGFILPTAIGMYSPKNKEVAVCKDKNELYFLNTCYHELSHFFIENYMDTPPIWLNEGLAVYFSSIIVSKSVKHKRNVSCIARVKTMLGLKDINLKDFVGWSPQKFYDLSFSYDNYGYALGYCMVSFLMQNKETMTAVINSIYKGKSSYEALDSVYEGGFAAFERDFIKSMGKVKSPKINLDFVYSLPVKPGDSIKSVSSKNNYGFTLGFDLSSAGDTVYACREGRVFNEQKSKENIANNRITISHKDGSFAEYSQFKKSLVRIGKKVKSGQPIALKDPLKVLGFVVYYRDENKMKYGLGDEYSHIIPVFHTSNAGDVKLEKDVVYIGKEQMSDIK